MHLVEQPILGVVILWLFLLLVSIKQIATGPGLGLECGPMELPAVTYGR